MGKHWSPTEPAVERRFVRWRWPLFAVAVVLPVAAVWAIAVDSAPKVYADEIPQPPTAAEPTRSVTPAGGAMAPNFDVVPVDLSRYDVVPLDPGKNGEFTERATRAARTAVQVASAEPEPSSPATTEPEPPADPLTDDGTFGDGCEQPGTRERCDPAPAEDDPLTDDGEFGDGCEEPGTRERCDPVVGLPPVIVEEPAEEETPVDEVEVVEPGTEVAG